LPFFKKKNRRDWIGGEVTQTLPDTRSVRGGSSPVQATSGAQTRTPVALEELQGPIPCSRLGTPSCPHISVLLCSCRGAWAQKALCVRQGRPAIHRFLHGFPHQWSTGMLFLFQTRERPQIPWQRFNICVLQWWLRGAGEDVPACRSLGVPSPEPSPGVLPTAAPASQAMAHQSFSDQSAAGSHLGNAYWLHWFLSNISVSGNV